MNEDEQDKRKGGSSTFLTDSLFGAISGAIAKTSLRPIECCKLALMHSTLGQGYPSTFTSTIRMIIKDEGITGLWRGNTQVLMTYCASQALNFGFKDLLKRTTFNYARDKDGYAKWLTSNIAAGAVAGAASLLILYPLDAARVLHRNDIMLRRKLKSEPPKYQNLRAVFKQESIAKLYDRFSLSCAGIMVYRGLYFGLFDTFKPKDSFVGSLFTAWLVTIAASCAYYPIDMVRRRMGMVHSAVKYKNSIHAFTEILQREGVRSLFKGAQANVMRAWTGALTLACYDKLQRVFFAGRI